MDVLQQIWVIFYALPTDESNALPGNLIAVHNIYGPGTNENYGFVRYLTEYNYHWFSSEK